MRPTNVVVANDYLTRLTANEVVQTGLDQQAQDGNFTVAKDKQRYDYVLTSRRLSENAALTQRHLALKRTDYEALEDEIEAVEQEVGFGADIGPARRSK